MSGLFPQHGGIGRKVFVRWDGSVYQQPGKGGCREVEGLAVERLVVERIETFDPGLFRDFDDIEVKIAGGLVPDDMIYGFIAVGAVSVIAGFYGGENGGIAGDLDAKGGIGQEDDDRVGGVTVEGGGIVGGDVAFEQP